jgi:thymidylate kinase
VFVRIRRVSRYFGKRRGVLIAFLGPDGAGKSSLIDELLQRRIDGPFPMVCVYMGKRDVFLPTSVLIRFLHREQDPGEKTASSSSGRQEGGTTKVVKDLAGLLNWILEQWARYLVKIRPVLQQGGIVLADRYAFDLANRPDFSVVHRPIIRKLLARLFPVPDRTYLLWEDPEVLFERKAEWPVDHLERNLERLREIVHCVPGSAEIRTNKPVSELARKLLAEASEIMGSRS